MADEAQPALNELTNIVAAIKGWADERTYTEVYGYSAPPFTKHELASLFEHVTARIQVLVADGVPPELAGRLPAIQQKLKAFRRQILPQLASTNAAGVFPPAALLLEWLGNQLGPNPPWEALPHDALPSNIRRRLRTASATLQTLEPQLSTLASKVEEINQAHDAAVSLPTDLHTLQEANKQLTEVSKQAEVSKTEIETNREEAKQHLAALVLAQSEASKTIELVQQAYAAATSRGLAASFDERANRLTRSVVYCVAGLVFALAIGSYIGSSRVAALSYAIASGQEWGRLLTELVFAILSIGAPLWFAWLMTKQIGQRFRLAEDYAFKASIARAYEGFRREAVRIDPAFEARLFASVLTRLDEPPLRLVETASHGSPYQELFNSEHFRRAMELIPELKDQFIAVAKAGFDKSIPRKLGPTPDPQPTPKPEG